MNAFRIVLHYMKDNGNFGSMVHGLPYTYGDYNDEISDSDVFYFSTEKFALESAISDAVNAFESIPSVRSIVKYTGWHIERIGKQ
jgi:hypothetical protein